MRGDASIGQLDKALGVGQRTRQQPQRQRVNRFRTDDMHLTGACRFVSLRGAPVEREGVLAPTGGVRAPASNQRVPAMRAAHEPTIQERRVYGVGIFRASDLAMEALARVKHLL